MQISRKSGGQRPVYGDGWGITCYRMFLSVIRKDVMISCNRQDNRLLFLPLCVEFIRLVRIYQDVRARCHGGSAAVFRGIPFLKIIAVRNCKSRFRNRQCLKGGVILQRLRPVYRLQLFRILLIGFPLIVGVVGKAGGLGGIAVNRIQRYIFIGYQKLIARIVGNSAAVLIQTPVQEGSLSLRRGDAVSGLDIRVRAAGIFLAVCDGSGSASAVHIVCHRISGFAHIIRVQRDITVNLRREMEGSVLRAVLCRPADPVHVFGKSHRILVISLEHGLAFRIHYGRHVCLADGRAVTDGKAGGFTASINRQMHCPVVGRLRPLRVDRDTARRHGLIEIKRLCEFRILVPALESKLFRKP